jgi:hypothetical protein
MMVGVRAWRLRTLVACAFFTCQVIPYFAVGIFVSQVMSAASNLVYAYLPELFPTDLSASGIGLAIANPHARSMRAA